MYVSMYTQKPSIGYKLLHTSFPISGVARI